MLGITDTNETLLHIVYNIIIMRMVRDFPDHQIRFT